MVRRMGDKAKLAALAVVAVLCCIGLPIVAGLLGASFAASELGEAAFAVVVLATLGAVWWRLRKRREAGACAEAATTESSVSTPRRS